MREQHIGKINTKYRNKEQLPLCYIFMTNCLTVLCCCGCYYDADREIISVSSIAVFRRKL